MSAFMHDAEHFRVIVHAAANFRPREAPLTWYVPGAARRTEWSGPQAAMTLLVAANARSIAARYPEGLDDDERAQAAITTDAEAVALGFDYGRGPAERTWDDREVLQALSSLDYQSCEAADWEASEAHAFVEALRHRLVDRYVRTLDDDAQTPWSIDRNDVSAHTKRVLRARADLLARQAVQS